jgi:ParB family transcriptional regulator, chromosome partitioning protein
MPRIPKSASQAAALSGATLLALSVILPSALNPRTLFDEDAIAQLAESIQEEGLLSPIVVRPKKDTEGSYEIVAGERRYRACKLLGLDEVRVIVRADLEDDLKALTAAIVENVQREDLEVFDLARAYKKLRELGHPLKEVARLAKRSNPDISNTIRLLDLPESVQLRIQRKELSPSHGKALLGLAEWPDELERLAEQAIENGNSSHGLEGIVNSVKRRKEAERSPPLEPEVEVEAEEKRSEPEKPAGAAPPAPALPPMPPPSLPTRPTVSSSSSSSSPLPAPRASTPASTLAPVVVPPTPEPTVTRPSALTGFVNLMICQEDHDWMIENRVKPKQIFAEARKLRELVNEEVEKLAEVLAEHYGSVKGEPVTLKTAIATALWSRAVELELLDSSVATNAIEEEKKGETSEAV